MAHTRNSVKKSAPHARRSGRRVVASSNNAPVARSSSNNKSGQRTDTKKSVDLSDEVGIQHFDGAADDEADEDDGSDEASNGEDIDDAESEGDESENYYPTKIAKKREAEQADHGKNVNMSSQGVKEPKSKVTHKAPQARNLTKTSTASSVPPGIPCIACKIARRKCNQDAEPGQPCERCARMRLQCVVDPKHKRLSDRVSHGSIARRTKTDAAAAHELIEDESSDDPLNIPVPLKPSALHKTTSISSGQAESSCFAREPTENHYSSSSSPLSSAPESNDDELDITMAGAKKTNNDNKKQGASTSTPKPSSKQRLTKAAARKGPAQGISPVTNNVQQQMPFSSLRGRESKPSGTLVPEQNILMTEPPVINDNTNTSNKGKGKDQAGLTRQHKNTLHDALPVDHNGRPEAASQFRYDPPASTPAGTSRRFTSAVPGETKSTPTFLPDGHGSVLNSDSDDIGPLLPISQLGQGGAYIGRYDAHLAAGHTTELTKTSINTQISTVQAPFATSGQYHRIRGSHTNALIQQIPTTVTSLYNDMHTEGTPAYRYSATKILFLLKQGQRAQLLALGGAYIAPDTVAQLNIEVEGLRQRAIALWHEVHDHVSSNSGHTYDVGGLAFLERMGR